MERVSTIGMSLSKEMQQRIQDYAESHDIPHRKALFWTPPYHYEERIEFLQSLPEYGVVEIQAGGVIAVEDKNG